MADIHPFCGVHYNRSKVKDLAEVICPPYDIISPQLQQELYQRSDYNFVRLEHNRELPQDTTTDNKYTRSAAILEQWLKQRVLVADKTPSLYLHDHYFQHNGREYKRHGVIAGVRLQEWADNVVRPHEGTLAEHTNDRLSLLWVCQANTSPILALFEDKKGQVSAPLEEIEKSLPLLSSTKINGERHDLWAINEPKTLKQIGAVLADQPLYIADGHHRYESALTYRRERRACASSVSGDEAFNFVMMEMVAFSDPGLVILPAHRLVRGMSKAALSELVGRLRSFFEVEELPMGKADVWKQVDGLLSGGGSGEVRLVLLGLVEGHLLQLRLRDFSAAGQMMPHFHSELYKRLDVDIVDSVIPHKPGGESVVSYSYDGREAVKSVLQQESQLAFLLSPVRAEAVKAIADAGDKMSRKATYFYPKAPAGLVLHRLD
jgi:uncharacterized protein (DUF1015 family)